MTSLRIAVCLALVAASVTAVGFRVFHDRDHPPPFPPSVAAPQSALPMPKRSATRLTLPEFHALVESGRGIILDARPEWNYRQGHVPGALSFPPEDFENAHARLESRLRANGDQPVVIYCAHFHCSTGGELLKKLTRLGHDGLALFPAGWNAWRETGLPEEMP